MKRCSEVTDLLEIMYPIIQGPFGGGISTSRLVAAVSNAGGLGSFGAHLLEPEEIEALGREIREQTDRSFAINLWVSGEDPEMDLVGKEGFRSMANEYRSTYESLGVDAPGWPVSSDAYFERQVEGVLRVRPKVLSFVFGVPERSILEECRRCGIITIGAATTVDEALAVEEAGVDMLVASGPEAGGHRPSFLRRAEDSLVGTLSLVPMVRDAVKIPVIAAGGIADSRGVNAAFALGANAVQLGTAFLACKESGASDIHREALFEAAGKATVLSRAFTGRLARFMENRFIESFRRMGGDALPYPMQSWLTAPIKRKALELGDKEHVALYASQSSPLIEHRKAADLMASLIDGLA